MMLPSEPYTLPDNVPDTFHVAIVGGGIAGLSAAFYLQRAARAAAAPLRYTLIEREARLGGKIRTDTVDSAAGEFVVEGGPDSFVTQKPWGVQLARDLGLEDQLMGINEARHAVYVLVRGRPCPMPAGMKLIVPTRLVPFMRSPLLSLRGRLRMALDLVIPPRRGGADETLGDFISRHFGPEALDRLAEPLLSGIHSAAPEHQSLLATFPRFRALEEQYGSLIRGMLAQGRTTNDERRTTADKETSGQGDKETRESPISNLQSFDRLGTPPSSILHPPSSKQSSVVGSSAFATLRGGVGELVRALVAALDGRLISGRGVAAIDRDSSSGRPYRLRLDDGELIEADAVILTAPAFAAADLVAQFQPALADRLRAIRYVSTGVVSLAYRDADLGDPLDGLGLLVPRSERRRINALTISSAKFAHRAPGGCALLRVFVGGSRTPETLDLDDHALLGLVRAELRDILHIDAAPLWSRVHRWQCAQPQYDVGHLDRVSALEALLPPGLHLAGCAYRGVGIPDCIRDGQQAAEQALAHVLASRQSSVVSTED
jgi:protoporphyrinogen/coproporphyrinogen III oxidase